MFRRMLVKAAAAGLCATLVASAVAQENRVSASKKGSLLVYSNVEVKYDDQGNVIQDTFIELTNDTNVQVRVQLYFINGDAATAEEPGWNNVDNEILLTPDEPSYWAASTGQPKGVSPWNVLDPGDPAGRPDPDDANLRTIRGYILAWAVNADAEQIRHNHLTGDAIVINYAAGTAFEYKAYAFQALDPYADGDVVGVAGNILLNGVNYDYGFDQLLLDFYATGSMALSGGGQAVGIDTDLTLYPVTVDLRQDNNGPILTKAEFAVWNMNETRFSGMTRCIECWDQSLVSNYAAPNHMLLQFLQTDKGKARIDGVRSTVCDRPDRLSSAASLLGSYARLLSFEGGLAQAATGDVMVGQGTQAAQIQYDPVNPGGELNPSRGLEMGGFGLGSFKADTP
ncbi:MAG: hypothetical protein AB7Q17_12155 [Phycisphaerae bacterium]